MNTKSRQQGFNGFSRILHSCTLEESSLSIGRVIKSRSVIDTKESDGIDDPMEKITIKSHSDHSDSGIGKMLILIDAYFVILLLCNKMTK